MTIDNMKGKINLAQQGLNFLLKENNRHQLLLQSAFFLGFFNPPKIIL